MEPLRHCPCGTVVVVQRRRIHTEGESSTVAWCPACDRIADDELTNSGSVSFARASDLAGNHEKRQTR